MKKIWLIIKREYITRVRKRSFILTTLLAPLGIFLLMGSQIFFMKISGEDEKNIAYVNESGFDIILPDSETGSIKYKKVVNQNCEHLKATFTEKYDGVLCIPPVDLSSNQEIRLTYVSEKRLGMMAKTNLKRTIASKIKDKKMQFAGIDEQVLKDLEVKVGVNEQTETGIATSSDIATGIGIGVGMLMYIILIVYGTFVMRGVMEEKVNRIVEVILSSVRPFQLMMGKIFGIGAVGLTQFIIWIVLIVGFSFLIPLFVSPEAMQPTAQMPTGMEMNPSDMEAQVNGFMDKLNSLPLKWMTFAFLIYFFGGYLLYASMFAAIGAAAGDNSEDSQSLVFIVMIPIIISVYILMAIQENPMGGLAFWSSMIPFSSPIIMPARMAFGVPIWEVLLSMLFLFGGFVATTWLAARIYRIGILMYGKKVSFKEIGKWVFSRG